MYELACSQPQGDAGQFVTPAQDAVTLYATSQPTSYVYQQTSTVAYRQLYHSDKMPSFCASLSSAPPPPAVFIQDAGTGQVSSLPPPAHFVVPPPPSDASSVGPQTFTAAAGITPQFSFAQPSFEMQRSPAVYQQAAAYSGFSASGVPPPESFSVFGALQPTQPPPPPNSSSVSYWMSLS